MCGREGAGCVDVFRVVTGRLVRSAMAAAAEVAAQQPVTAQVVSLVFYFLFFSPVLI